MEHPIYKVIFILQSYMVLACKKLQSFIDLILGEKQIVISASIIENFVDKPFWVESGYYILSLSDRERNHSKFSGLNLKINSINQCFAKGFCLHCIPSWDIVSTFHHFCVEPFKSLAFSKYFNCKNRTYIVDKFF